MRKIFTLLLIAFSISNMYAANLGDIITLDLSKSIHPASFTYSPEGYWTETYNDEDYTFINFDHFSFSHLIDRTGSSWGGFSWDGFTVCNSGDSTNYIGEYGWDYTKQWGNMAGGGIKTDENGNVLKDDTGKVQAEQGIPYLVAYYSAWTMNNSLQTIFSDSVPYQAVGAYINASPWSYYDVLYGEGVARAFAEGDYFKLFIHGLNKNYEDNGKVVEYTLAEFTSGSLHQSPDWQWVDLSSLGEVYGLYYTMETTDVGDYGANTATYFCLDKLQIRKTDGTSIKAPEIKTSIAVYPNPFTDYIEVNTTAIGVATVYNLSGAAVLSINLNNGCNRINTSTLPKGIYLLKYNDNTVKLVK